VDPLREARGQASSLRKGRRLAHPPVAMGVPAQGNEDARSTCFTSGRRMRRVSPCRGRHAGGRTIVAAHDALPCQAEPRAHRARSAPSEVLVRERRRASLRALGVVTRTQERVVLLAAPLADLPIKPGYPC